MPSRPQVVAFDVIETLGIRPEDYWSAARSRRAASSG